MTEPRDEGAAAFHEGLTSDDNPYDRISDPDNYFEWREGFDEAQFGGADDRDGEDEPSGEVPDLP